jgi:SAM-dependent methyltransferase
MHIFVAAHAVIATIERRGAVSDWIAVTSCPACGSGHRYGYWPILSDEYEIGAIEIPFPLGGIGIERCAACGLFFKNRVPSREFLARAFSGPSTWDDSYNFYREKRQLRKYFGRRHYSLLDVGAGRGGLLRCVREDASRISALDFSDFGAKHEITGGGEFIEAWIDDSILNFTGEPYDVVTLFDVLEHLYDPDCAFVNLGHLLAPCGLIIIETGNADWLGRPDKIRDWWYAKLFEHHVFWSLPSIEALAQRHGFRVVCHARVRHKTWSEASAARVGFQIAKVLAHKSAKRLYRATAHRFGIAAAPYPRSPLPRDHLRIVLARA